MGKKYWVAIIKENDGYWLEVYDKDTNEVVKTYDEKFYDTLEEVNKFINNVIEPKFNPVFYHEKDLMDY